jgi:SAM-dependent methyltransferase
LDGFKQTYLTLLPLLNKIVGSVISEPIYKQKGTSHIDRLGAIAQYSYYVSVVRHFVKDLNADILDWGCQHGQVTKLMSHFFKNTRCYVLKDDSYYNEYGLEYWHKVLSVAAGSVVFGADPAKINLPPCSMDVILSSGVLEHVHEIGGDDVQALSDINRVLKMGGLLFIWNLPFKYGSVEMLNHLLGRWHHDRRYTKKEVVSLLERSGFEIIFFDHHELMNMMTRNIIGKVIGHDNAFIIDYYLSKLPLFNLVAQHFTIVAKKKINYS